MMSNPPSISTDFVTAGSGTIPGGDGLEELVNGGLIIVDDRGGVRPQLAEAVPTLENGRWRLLPDGRMETTWTIRPGAQWHDGVPFTSADPRFSARLGQDRDLPVFRHRAFDLVEGVETPDPRTVMVRWTQPYIAADLLFSRGVGFPRPSHLLEKDYVEDKTAILQHAYWTEGYAGTGPFRLREWVGGSHLVLAANEQYVLGRPKIDEILVRFIPDQNALVANLLAGAVELTFGRSLSLEQAIQVTNQWREGKADVGFKNWIALYPQFLNPSPTVVLDVQFRRAMLHAIDRQQLADTLQGGLVPVAHSFLSPTDPDHDRVKDRIVRYDYDPPRAVQMIEGLGYSRGPDGVFRDGAGQRLALEVFDGLTEDLGDKALLAVADYWGRIGVPSQPVFIPEQRRNDREYGATFPSFRIIRQPNDPLTADRYHTRARPLPENRFSGTNRSRYSNLELDALMDRYVQTIPKEERTRLLGNIIYHMTDQLVIMGLFYNTEPVMVGNRLRNVTTKQVGGTTEAWNAHEWEVM
jgi:peptide/nickel transport system substrate-binding protein